MPADTPSILQRPHASGSPPPADVLVAGASGGIGQALCRHLVARYPYTRLVRLARRPEALPRLDADCLDIACDIADEDGIEQAIAAVPADRTLDWALIASGWLHGDGYTPEKTWRQLDAAHLLHAYRLNAVGPALLLKQLLARLNPDYACRIGVLSARVGSISDNRLGGWHAYRASKAALNMLLKNIALELARKRDDCSIVGLQPGTTDTALSRPFQRNVARDELQTPDYTAQQLLRVMQALQPQDSGRLFDFLGLPFDP